MAEKWDRSINDDFNKAAEGEQRQPAERNDKGSDQVRKTRHGLQGGPPPPKGPGMAIVRQQHREAMAKDHERATGKGGPSTPRKGGRDKKTPQKGDLKKDLDRSR